MTTRSKVLVMRETRSAYLFLLPSMIFFVGFVIIPMFMCLFTSFFNYTMNDFKFVGSAYCCCGGSYGNHILTVGGFIHLQNARGDKILLPVRILSSGSNRYGSGSGSMEMDVQ